MQRWLRLRHRSDFKRLRQEGDVKRHPTLILSYTANDRSHNRYGFIISKRIGKAVVRNRIRRLLREAVRLLHPQLKTGNDLVFIARPAIVGQPFAEIERIVFEMCRKARLLTEEMHR